MKIIANEHLSDISGGTIIPTLISSVTGALKYEFGRQVVEGCYQVANTVVGLLISPTPTPVTSFRFVRDFNVPASYIATFALGLAAGAGLMKLSHD